MSGDARDEERRQVQPEKAPECGDHKDFAGTVCPVCAEPVDDYGNTAYDFKYCSFPDCGCDGARLCMAGRASDRALDQNVEGMWSGKTRKQRQAVFGLINSLRKDGDGG